MASLSRPFTPNSPKMGHPPPIPTNMGQNDVPLILLNAWLQIPDFPRDPLDLENVSPSFLLWFVFW